MAEQSPNELIQKYLDATISAEEFQTLEKLITSDPVVADAFARAGRLDSALSAYFVEAESIDASAAVARNAVEEIRAADDYLPPKPQRRGWQVGSIAIAACLLIAAGVGVWFALPRQQQVPTKELAQNVHQLLSGRARVDGKENQPPRDGSRVETFDETVLIAMADGSRVELAPESTAVLRGQVGDIRQVVALSRGSGKFQVEKGQRQFRVETPIGNVMVLGTEFVVQVQELESFEGDDDMMMRTFLSLAVAVTAGQVEVQINGKVHVLSAGQTQVFADEKPAKVDLTDFKRAADMAGTVVKIDEKAGTLVLNARSRENPGPVTFALAKDVKVFVEGDKAGKLADLPENKIVQLYLNEDKSTVLAIRVDRRAVDGVGDRPANTRRPDAQGRFGGFDEKAGTMVLLIAGDGGERKMTFTVDKELKVGFDEKQLKLGEVPQNAYVLLMLDAARTNVVSMNVNTRPDRRIVQAVDAVKSTIQFQAEGRDLIFPVAKDVRVVIDGKEAKLADVPADAACTVMMSLDRLTVLAITVGKGSIRRPDGERKEGDRRPDGEKKLDGDRKREGDK